MINPLLLLPDSLHRASLRDKRTAAERYSVDGGQARSLLSQGNSNVSDSANVQIL
jgi:hypothetical protein